MRTAQRGRVGRGTPVYAAVPVPGEPQVGVERIDGVMASDRQALQAHSHDFPALAYVEDGTGTVLSGGRTWSTEAGDLYVMAPGEVIDGSGIVDQGPARGWAVFFTPEALGPDVPGANLAWRAHPLLFPFVRGAAQGVLRLRVSAADRPTWSQRIAALHRELRDRRDGYREAVLAYLILLLVDVSRLAADVVGDLRRRDEPLLAEVFDVIEHRYADPLSLRDVARAVSLSPGHLTTIVRRKTGRTVQAWITERRMVQARRLLVGTDLPVEEVGRRVGYPSPGYFARTFRRAHGMSPREWRRAGEGSPAGPAAVR